MALARSVGQVIESLSQTDAVLFRRCYDVLRSKLASGGTAADALMEVEDGLSAPIPRCVASAIEKPGATAGSSSSAAVAAVLSAAGGVAPLMSGGKRKRGIVEAKDT